jgi:hypothetical protein
MSTQQKNDGKHKEVLKNIKSTQQGDVEEHQEHTIRRL